MSDDAPQASSSNNNASLAGVAAQILNAIGHADGGPATATRRAPAAENFLRCTRDQLLGFAKSLGLAGISKLSKTELATRLQAAFAGLTAKSDGGSKRVDGAGPAATDTGASDGADQTGFPPKYDLGPDAEEAQMPRHIPWGYGQDRVTAMIVDPDRLFVYWEVTDDALARGRKELGKGGAGAWLNLRVYDVTGRLFDGTNAHSYFDHKIERGDRQWFFDINKPTSSACVEIGLRSSEGFFVKLARSGRVEFPRREPVGGGHTEWLTVTNAGGPNGSMNGPMPGALPGTAAAPSARAVGSPGWDDGAVQAAAPHGAGDGGELEAVLIGGAEHQTERRWEWREGEHGAWQTELAAISWTEPVIRSTWEAGPFTYPVESPVFTEERQVSGGQLSYRTENGRVQITYGPWQVVIRGLGARAERRVLATWQVTHSWSTLISSESTPTQWKQLAPGSSEWVALGGSERHWLMGSELRLLGASEKQFVGASEYRFRGASERLAAGASEYLYRGASERLLGGASEQLTRGASERILGSSEQRLVYPVTPGGDNGEQR
jgi:hypothetical protein